MRDSQPALKVAKRTYKTCATCYKAESKTESFKHCGKCKKQAYCSKECQTKDWPRHKKTCEWQGANRESLPARGTEERDTLSAIKRWFGKHTRILVYCATHAMELHRARNTANLRTRMLVITLDEVLDGFTFRSGAICDMEELGLDAQTRAALAQRADEVGAELPPRNSLTIFVRCEKVVYLAPITIPRLPSLGHVIMFGPPDGDWLGFLERGINGTLKESDRARVEKLKEQV